MSEASEAMREAILRRLATAKVPQIMDAESVFAEVVSMETDGLVKHEGKGYVLTERGRLQADSLSGGAGSPGDADRPVSEPAGASPEPPGGGASPAGASPSEVLEVKEVTLRIRQPREGLPIMSAYAQATVIGPEGEESRLLATRGSLVEFTEGVRCTANALGIKILFDNRGEAKPS